MKKDLIDQCSILFERHRSNGWAKMNGLLIPKYKNNLQDVNAEVVRIKYTVKIIAAITHIVGICETRVLLNLS